jgi:ribosomal protein S18 acetylase RimI-like enzyme
MRAEPRTGAQNFLIRPIQPSEFERVGDLTAAAYAPRYAGSDPYVRELRDVAGRARACPILVAIDADGTVVGAVTYVPDSDNPMSEVERVGEAGLRMLAVDPVAQGRGVGRALTVACVERARSEGRTGLALLTEPDNDAAHRLYLSLGFVRDPERDWEYEAGKQLIAFQLPF